MRYDAWAINYKAVLNIRDVDNVWWSFCLNCLGPTKTVDEEISIVLVGKYGLEGATTQGHGGEVPSAVILVVH